MTQEQSQDQNQKEQGKPDKQAWHKPEVVNVGGVIDTTTEKTGNVRDPGSNPMTYNRN
jgi:hypothetical protein